GRLFLSRVSGRGAAFASRRNDGTLSTCFRRAGSPHYAVEAKLKRLSRASNLRKEFVRTILQWDEALTRRYTKSSDLRVAMVAGTLGQGGAEKQLVYIANALHQAGVEVRVYSLTRGEFYESSLRALGIAPIWIGRFNTPLARVSA